MRLAVKVALCVVALPVGAAAGLLARAARTHALYNAYHEPLTNSLSVSSGSFAPDGDIPERFTCHAHGDSPDVRWSQAPVNTKSYVITLLDWDVPTPVFPLHVFTHWILFDVPAERNEIAASSAPTEMPEKPITAGTNSFNALGYVPPCPPHGRHRYVVRVYALDVPDIHPTPSDRLGVQEAMRGHILAFGETAGFVQAERR